MLIVAVILCICCMIISYISFYRDFDTISITTGIMGCILGIICIIMIFEIIDYGSNMFIIDDKIKMYEEENKNIENQITEIVNNYQGYEKDIINNVADMEVMLIKIPELKSSELVNTQMKVYIENNNKIKELKEEKINNKVAKFLLYFGH